VSSGEPPERPVDRGDALDDGGTGHRELALLEGDDRQRREGLE